MTVKSFMYVIYKINVYMEYVGYIFDSENVLSV